MTSQWKMGAKMIFLLFWPCICVLSKKVSGSSYGSDCDVPSVFDEIKNGKGYRLIRDDTSHLEATIQCQVDGGNLAMIKTPEDYDAVTSIIGAGNLDEDVWIGLVNPSFESCIRDNSGDSCIGKFGWVDGTMVDQDTYEDLSYAHMDDATYCIRMKKDSEQKVADKECDKKLFYLCQHDCQSPSHRKDVCPPAAESDFVYGASFYQSFFTDEENYEGAMSACQTAGGTLPTVDTQESYIVTRALAGQQNDKMWIGLQARQGAVCRSPTECSNKLLHVAYEEGSLETWSFVKEDWFTNNLPMDIDGGNANKVCLSMDKGKDNMIASENCNSKELGFFCKIPCHEEDVTGSTGGTESVTEDIVTEDNVVVGNVVESCTWTGWINRDNVDKDGDDVESVEIILPCLKEPLHLGVKTHHKDPEPNKPANQTGQVFRVNSAAQGFECYQKDQANNLTCRNYNVKFCCPDVVDPPEMNFCETHPDHKNVTVLWKGSMTYEEGKAACAKEGMGLPVIRRPHHMWAVALGQPGRRGEWWSGRDFFLDARAFGKCVNETCGTDNIIWNDGGDGFKYEDIEGWLGVELDIGNGGDETCLQVHMTKIGTGTGKTFGVIRNISCDQSRHVFCFADCSNPRTCSCPPPTFPNATHVGPKKWLLYPKDVNEEAKGNDQTYKSSASN